MIIAGLPVPIVELIIVAQAATAVFLWFILTKRWLLY